MAVAAFSDSARRTTTWLAWGALAFLLTVMLAAPVTAQIPADVSMGFAFGAATPTVSGEVTEHLNDRLAVVGGAYWGSMARASTVGFYVGPRLYTESAGRFRPFGELAFGFSQSRLAPARLRLAHALTFTPSLGVEAGIGARTRVRTSMSYGLAVGLGEGAGLNVTTALVLIPARERER